MKRSKLLVLLTCSIVFGISIEALRCDTGYANDLIPAIKSDFYYKMGGGDDIPLPAFDNTSYLPLDVDSNVGLGFDCGAFNPVASITNSLNEIKSSALNVEKQVLAEATSAVTEFPLYELSRADPSLYDLITNAIAGAHDDVAVSTKSCEVMQSEIAAGDDPYAHWGQVALGNRWQQEIGSAEISGDGDINEARETVSQDAGKSGVPWVNPDSALTLTNNQTYYAGGENQPAIHVIHDTVMAGYQVIVNDGLSTDHQNGALSDAPSEITNVFPTAQSAADWVTNMVGDETMTTYNGGDKSSQPGVGLYADIQTQTQALLPKLQALISGSTPLTIDALQDVSVEGMALSPQIIQDIQTQAPVTQSIMTNKLAQNSAAMTVINKARLAIQLLQSGARIPAIYSNKAAQDIIEQAINRLQQDVEAMLLFVNARQTLLSNMLSIVSEAGQSQKNQNTAIAMPKPNESIMENGAIANPSAAISDSKA